MSRVASFVLALALVSAPAAAHADEEVDKPQTVSNWYGWQTLAVDGSSLLLLAASAKWTAVGGLGLGGYFLGAPIVHAAHGHGGRALGSGLLRIGAPIGGAFIGAMIAGVATPKNAGLEAVGDGLSGILIGGAAGAALAIGLDAAFLAREDVPAPRTSGPLVPWVSVAGTGASAGVAKTF